MPPGLRYVQNKSKDMKTRILAPIVSAVALFTVIGCSSEPAQATPEQVKNFAGGPPPANYMDKANAATKAGQDAAKDAKKGP